MKRSIVFLFGVIHFVISMASSADVSEYFPIGTEWKEVIVELSMPYDTTSSVTYKICGDTLIGNTEYKTITVNGKAANLWLREADNCVWLLTAEYPNEFKIYDFNWNTGEVLQTEYLRETQEGDMKLLVETGAWDYKSVDLGKTSYQYYMNGFYSTVIRGIGRVSELHRNSCLIGYKMMAVILPGLVYHKVLWLRRNGQTIFRSEEPEEWVTYIPTNIKHPNANDSKSLILYDLQGRRLNAKPTKGVYIQRSAEGRLQGKNGKKYVMK